jgi:hypothetical protein
MKRAFHLGTTDLGFEGADHSHRHLILKLEYVGQVAFKPISPEVHTRCRINKLTNNAQAGSSLPHAAFQHVANAKFLADLSDVR